MDLVDIPVNPGFIPPFISIDLSGFGIAVEAGDVLAIKLTAGGSDVFEWFGAQGDPYFNGDAYFSTFGAWSLAEFPRRDLDFRTFVDEFPLQFAVAAIEGKLDTSLDETVSSRASQTSLDELQSSVDGLSGGGGTVDLTPVTDAIAAVESKLDADLDETVSSRASQASVDFFFSLFVDQDGVPFGATQTSVDAIEAKLDTIRGLLDTGGGGGGTVDETVSSRLSDADFRSFFAGFFDATGVPTGASQTSVDAIEAKLDAIEGTLDTWPDDVSSRVEVEILSMDLSSQSSVDAHSDNIDVNFDNFVDTAGQTVIMTEIL